MTTVNVNDLQELHTLNLPGADLNIRLTFYYDETINPRTFHLKNGKFNYPIDSNFVLGGLMYEGRKPDLEPLFKSLKLQASVKDAKFKHIAKGDFPECLNSQQLHLYLTHLKKSSIYVHFSTINLFYFSIIDIVDSLIAVLPREQFHSLDYIFWLKQCFYQVCRSEQSKVVELFTNYQYPNIKAKDVKPFIKKLIIILEGHDENMEALVGVRVLTQRLRQSISAGKLPFVMNNEDFILVKDFSSSYLHPICLYPKSQHIFDEETFVSSIIDQHKLVFNKKPLKNYCFIKSETDLFIQASDIWVGLVGKIFKFFNTHSRAEILELGNYLNTVQQRNLALYFDLIDKTDSKSRYFLQYTVSTEDSDKMAWLYQAVHN